LCVKTVGGRTGAREKGCGTKGQGYGKANTGQPGGTSAEKVGLGGGAKEKGHIAGFRAIGGKGLETTKERKGRVLVKEGQRGK